VSEIQKGDEVIGVAAGFPTTVNPIVQFGAIPVFVDVELNTHNINADLIEAAITPKTKAIMLAHTLGNPFNLATVKALCDKYKLWLVEDCCDALGATFDGKMVGTWGDIATLSFYPAHHMTTGEGGAVLTNNKTYEKRARSIREWGRASGTDKIYKYPGFPPDYRERYVYEEIGYNLKPLELQCAMGRVQLTRLDGFRKKRIANYQYMSRILQDIPFIEQIESDDDATICWFSFPMYIKGGMRKKVMDMLEENNIECRTIFSGNILKHPAYKNTISYVHSGMPNADRVMHEGMFLSVHPSITKEQMNFIHEVLCTI
jgi:CDP-6-deoxy-D-xylo-4-hexulose-3-dehydrase